MVGACAVQVGTANYLAPAVGVTLAADLAAWCAAHDVRAVRDVVGTLTLSEPSRLAAEPPRTRGRSSGGA